MQSLKPTEVFGMIRSQNQCIAYNYLILFMSKKKIMSHSESNLSRKSQLQIHQIGLSKEDENIVVINQYKDHEGPQHGLAPQIFSKKEPTIIEGTTDGNSAFSSRKHTNQRHSKITNNLDAMTIIKQDSKQTNLLSVMEQKRQRKRSGNFQEKATQLLIPEATGMKPNLFMGEDNFTPLHVPNGNLAIKRHQEEQYNAYNQQTRTNKLKQQQSRYPSKKQVQEQPKQETFVSTDKKKVKRLPSMNANDDRNSHFFSSHQSSNIIINKNRPKQSQVIIESHNELLQTQLNQIQKPINRKATFKFVRQSQFGKNYIHPDYKILSSDGRVQLQAKKQYCYFNSYYNITISSFGSEIVLANLRGNFAGSQFNLFRMRNNQQQMIATIIYDSSCGTKYRTTEVYVKTSEDNDPVFNRQATRRNLKELYNEGHANIMRLASKFPTWNQATKTYTLSFGGKCKQPSTKNIILVPSNDPKTNALMFCKIDTNIFHLQVGKHLSLLVAMGILMSSFDFKLLIQ